MITFPKPKPRLLAKRRIRASKATNWTEVRKAVLVRDKHWCRACRGEKALDVHHVIFRSMGGRDEACNLISLCRRCHEDVHGHVLKLRWADDANPAKTVKFEWVS